MSRALIQIFANALFQPANAVFFRGPWSGIRQSVGNENAGLAQRELSKNDVMLFVGRLSR
jgi:hypothetical protein